MLKRRFYLLLLLCGFASFAVYQTACSDARAGSAYTNMYVSDTIGATVSDFGLHDQAGDFHRLYYNTEASAVVLYTQGNSCPIVRNAIPALNELRAEFADKGVRFFLLNANLQDDRASIAKEAEEFGIDFPILVDESQLVAESLGLKRTNEAIIIQPKSWKILYRGPINDRLDYEKQKDAAKHHYLKDALTQHLAGQKIAEAEVKGPGCLINLPNQKVSNTEAPTFTEDVAPIMQKTCQKCHIENGIGSWAMSSYEMVRGWAPMIREVVRTKRMPPWQADPHVGKFANDFSLTNEEAQTLVHWVEAGTPRGPGEDPLKENPKKAGDWLLGEPDHIVTMDTVKIPKTGVVEYQYQIKEIELKEDKWVEALEVIPGNTAVLHHVLVSPMYPKGYQPPMQQRSEWFDGLFAAYAPGQDPEIFPEGSGRFLPKGTKLVFQLHYTPSGKEEFDVSKLGIHFADGPKDKEYLITGPVNLRFAIEPNNNAYPVNGAYKFDEPVTLHAMTPHMHYRGKSMKYSAVYPDGTKELLISVPNYDFNWQRTYILDEPKDLPAGTAILCEALFDNSKENVANPDPNATVYFGEQSFEEMMIGYLSFVRTNKKMAAGEEKGSGELAAGAP